MGVFPTRVLLAVCESELTHLKKKLKINHQVINDRPERSSEIKEAWRCVPPLNASLLELMSSSLKFLKSRKQLTLLLLEKDFL